jgi:hypothetical protein
MRVMISDGRLYQHVKEQHNGAILFSMSRDMRLDLEQCS